MKNQYILVDEINENCKVYMALGKNLIYSEMKRTHFNLCNGILYTIINIKMVNRKHFQDAVEIDHTIYFPFDI